MSQWSWPQGVPEILYNTSAPDIQKLPRFFNTCSHQHSSVDADGDKSCPIPSTLSSASTGVCGPASQSDGAIITHHSSEWKSGSTQPAHCTVWAPGRGDGMDTQIVRLDARDDSFRGWRNILSACDPRRVISSRGQDSDQEDGWMNRVAGGGMQKKEAMCETWQW